MCAAGDRHRGSYAELTIDGMKLAAASNNAYALNRRTPAFWTAPKAVIRGAHDGSSAERLR